MASLLYEIYSGNYEITPLWSKEWKELEQRLSVEWDKIQRMLGDQFVDELLTLEAERSELRSFQCYQEGFRLGVRLMLEALTAATA